jgi:hypothetical protein
MRQMRARLSLAWGVQVAAETSLQPGGTSQLQVKSGTAVAPQSKHEATRSIPKDFTTGQYKCGRNSTAQLGTHRISGHIKRSRPVVLGMTLPVAEFHEVSPTCDDALKLQLMQHQAHKQQQLVRTVSDAAHQPSVGHWWGNPAWRAASHQPSVVIYLFNTCLAHNRPINKRRSTRHI